MFFWTALDSRKIRWNRSSFSPFPFWKSWSSTKLQTIFDLRDDLRPTKGFCLSFRSVEILHRILRNGASSTGTTSEASPGRVRPNCNSSFIPVNDSSAECKWRIIGDIKVGLCCSWYYQHRKEVITGIFIPSNPSHPHSFWASKTVYTKESKPVSGSMWQSAER